MANLLIDPIVKAKIDELLGITTTELWLNVVWSILIDIVGYDLSYSEKTIKRNGNDSDVLYLKSGPIAILTSVSIDDSDIDVTKFDIYNSNAIQYKLGYFYKNPTVNIPGRLNMYLKGKTDKVVVVAYTGFTAATLPDTIVYAASTIYSLEQYMIDNSHIEQKKIDEISWKVKSDNKINGRLLGLLEPYM